MATKKTTAKKTTKKPAAKKTAAKKSTRAGYKVGGKKDVAKIAEVRKAFREGRKKYKV